MTLEAQPSKTNPDEIFVNIPAWRPDILHECDIMEDAAIAYGFNNLARTFPTTNTVAQQLPVSKLCDVVRREWAYAGWVEVLPLVFGAWPFLRASYFAPNILQSFTVAFGATYIGKDPLSVRRMLPPALKPAMTDIHFPMR
jgi:tRNA synthetase B5 domain